MEWSSEVEWSQILCSLVGFIKVITLSIIILITYYNTHFHSSADYILLKIFLVFTFEANPIN